VSRLVAEGAVSVAERAAPPFALFERWGRRPSGFMREVGNPTALIAPVGIPFSSYDFGLAATSGTRVSNVQATSGPVNQRCQGVPVRSGLHILFLLLLAATLTSAQANDSPKLSVEERTFTASKVYSLVQGYFFSAKEQPKSGLDDWMTPIRPTYELPLRPTTAASSTSRR